MVRRRPTSRGFTLMEMLVAIALVMALFGSLFNFLFQLLSARSASLEHAQRQRSTIALIEWVETDLMTSIAGDQVAGSGVRGDNTSLTLLTRSVGATHAIRGVNDPGPWTDLHRSEYRFQEQGGTIEARREPVLRLGRSDGASGSSRALFERLGERIYKLRFRYHDGTEWLDEYDARDTGSLPAAIEIAVWYESWPGAEPLQEQEVSSGRETFDDNAGFDEGAYAQRSDLDVDVPYPDRIRVIVVPDARVQDPDGEQPQVQAP